MAETITPKPVLESSRLIDREMFWAAHKGDMPKVLELLEKGARAQYIEASDPLEAALEMGQLDIARIFLERGADPNKLTIRRTCLLLDNFRQERIGSMRLLLDHGADVNWLDELKANVLHHMCWSKDEDPTEAAQLLVDRGVNLEQKDSVGCTPLHSSARTGKTKMVDFLIGVGSNIHALDDKMQTPLHTAATNDNVEVVFKLIGAGCGVHALDVEGKTPLHWAAQKNQAQTMVALLAHGANPDCKDLGGKTPRDWAQTLFNFDALACLDAVRARSQIDAMFEGLRPLATFAPN
jgi:ankyrin repeat protein